MKNKSSLIVFAALIISLIYPFLQPTKADAAVTQAFVRFDRLSTGAAITGTACFETSTVGTETGVVVVFPLGWTISSTASNWTTSTTNLPTDPSDGSAANAWPTISAQASNVNGLSVTFTSGNLTVDTFYCFNFAGASSTIGSAGNDQTGQLKTQGGAPYVDSINWATSIVASNADQIAVTASVSATMTFSLSANSADLGTLSTSSVTSATGITQTVSTNARNGWISWMKSTNAALNSAASGGSLSAGAYQSGSGNVVDLASNTGYVVDFTTGTGTPTIAAEYDGTNTTSGGKLSQQFQQTVSATSPANGNTATVAVRAKAAATTPAAADYTDTLTLVAAGSF